MPSGLVEGQGRIIVPYWLTGSLAEAGANVPDGSYVLAANKTTGKQGFYVTDGSVTCPQFKCYLTVPAEAAAPKALFFPGGEGEQTGIENVFGADENHAAPPHRSEDGRVSAPFLSSSSPGKVPRVSSN